MYSLPFIGAPCKNQYLNPNMEVWKMIFLLNWVNFMFQPFIFKGVGPGSILYNGSWNNPHEWLGSFCSPYIKQPTHLEKNTKQILSPRKGYPLEVDPAHPWKQKPSRTERLPSSKHNFYLVVSTHLKNISEIGSSPQIGLKIKKYLKPPPSKFQGQTRCETSGRRLWG